MGARLEFLPWDTGHFGVRIGRLHADRFDADTAAAVRAWVRAERVRCVYWLAGLGRADSIRRAQEAGFRAVDVRVTLDADADALAAASPQRGVRRLVPADVARVARLSRTAFRDARFHRDGRFDRARCDRLYEIWARKECAADDCVVLVRGPRGAPTGFVTLRLDPAAVGRVGLVAVAAAGRGRGTGLALVRTALARARDRGAAAVSVVTQGSNVAAIRTYERAGFRVRTTELWLHCWSDAAR